MREKNMIEELQKVKNRATTLINHINRSYPDKEIRNLDYSSIDEAISIIEEFVSRVKLKKYRFSYSFVFTFSSLAITSEIHLLITKNSITHRLATTSNYSIVKHNSLLLNFHTKELTFNEKIESSGVLKEIAKRKGLRFSNTLVLDTHRRYYTVYFIDIPLKVETLEYII
jgi:hypothetical protein